MLNSINKKRLIADFLARLGRDLEQVTSSQKAAVAGATHEENKAEGDKDMRATEVSYIARGQAERVVGLRDELARAKAVPLRAFNDAIPLALGALFTLEDEARGEQHHLLMPGGGGMELSAHIDAGAATADTSITDAAITVSVISTRSPLGQALIGSFAGDAVSIELAGTEREWVVVDVA